MGRPIRWTGKKAVTLGDRKVTPNEVIEVNPREALELLRSDPHWQRAIRADLEGND